MPDGPSTDLESVSSSAIAAIGYDENERILEVQFLSGSIYEYRDVPEILAFSFFEAPSKGRFFVFNIRNFFAFSRVR